MSEQNIIDGLSELDIAALALETETHKLSTWLFGREKSRCRVCRVRAAIMLKAIHAAPLTAGQREGGA